MKKFFGFLFSVILIFSLAYVLSAETISVKESCQIMDTSDFKTSKKIGVAMAGEKFEALDKYGDYVKVKIMAIPAGGKDEVEMEGCLWTGNLEITGNMVKVLNKGSCLNPGPKKTDKPIGYVLPGRLGEIQKLYTTWYKIKQDKSGITGWISSICVK